MPYSEIQNPSFETAALHAGQTIDATKSRGVPLHRTTAYLFDSAEHAQNLFALKELGNIYTRLGNPTQGVLEERVAALERGAAALALASGTNAIFYSIINICAAGDEVVSSSNLYGGTHTMFNEILPGFGIKVHLVDPKDPEAIRAAVNDKTRVLYTETIGNPSLDVADLETFSAISKEYEIPLVVDSTFTTPYLLRPIEHGAHIVIHSLTKWIGGHGTAIGGIVVDSGTFNWQNPKFSQFNEPDGGYHGLRFASDLGDLNPLAFILRMRTVPLRNLGGAISPDNCWMFLQGIETLAIRMERHSENAMAVAEFLEAHPDVAWVRYPGLKSDPGHTMAVKYLKRGFGGMVVFGVKEGREAGQRFIEKLNLFSHVANVGDAKSLAIHPASTTHSQLSEEHLSAAGISGDLIRLSIGIENIKDIKADINQALK
ncbi:MULTISPECIES: O-acetylhomoserine aminocarboxypropyltransferase/cysteine synthase family protein [unclassified Oceanispirochaeta]|uniref:O-acetylhomoserine aminocarboxypropyltransferase/cysteine synthase family protein n=1 Tax=unclassified Oceanispirochaeta TaxID=2635722 RepID=UPI000E08FC9F|nr:MULTISPECIES: O-acetylhomoserine aminocarboxypropyltransferase/cysteine synthase family protein [unclassified Oceanispirochaeta]MBF9017063.1 O-acetylhomoserine aminocarboxypropyltransferase/cysteine synthase [Oceanispirochaeta sp. M2]NPD73512.1 O-acetylhomoserine aminocarboxypropyltransferase/cysteine synthase [Oceanispirochaeta sp. M1]RDG30802.1 O-acetylhomoserine aminocarboxypropyltransferase/cysteine synthase [Oceanispirochaeta sp. M1]